MLFLPLLLAVLGLANALHLRWQYKRYKIHSKQMFCLAGEDCAGVIGSKYGTTFGIKNEILGSAYYLLLIALLLAAPLTKPVASILILIAFSISVLGVLFSIYLLIVQSFILKKFCSWCLIAIGINFLILISLLPHTYFA